MRGHAILEVWGLLSIGWQPIMPGVGRARQLRKSAPQSVPPSGESTKTAILILQGEVVVGLMGVVACDM